MVQGVTYHLVSYYSVADVKRSLLERLSQSAALRGIMPRPELTLNQRFRAPLKENMDGTREEH
jgi:Gti1/Pac2 family transcription factor